MHLNRNIGFDFNAKAMFLKSGFGAFQSLPNSRNGIGSFGNTPVGRKWSKTFNESSHSLCFTMSFVPPPLRL